MTKFEILTITPFFPPNKGGLSYYVLNLNLNLVKQGHSVSIIAPKHITEEISYSNMIFKHIYRIPSIYLPGWPYPTLRSVSIPIDCGLKIRSIMRNGKFDIIHVHGHHFPITWIALNEARKLGIPSVLTLHGMLALNPNVLGGKSGIEDYFNTHIFSKILSKTNAVVGPTPHITDYARKFGSSSTRYFTIPNGVNTSLYKENLSRKKEFREKYGIGKNSRVILFCGRFEKVKGIVEFVNASKNIIKNGNTEVIIVGEGTLEHFVRSNLSNVDRVHLLKWQPPESIHEIYIASDIFAIPSQFEGVPLTVIEAMNAGLYIVYTPVGGIPQILKDYPPKSLLTTVSSEEIFNVLDKLIPNSSSTDVNQGIAYAQRFDWNEISIDICKVYDECINSQKT